MRTAQVSSPSLPTACSRTELWVALCPGGPRAECEAGSVGARDSSEGGRGPSASPWWLPAWELGSFRELVLSLNKAWVVPSYSIVP